MLELGVKRWQEGHKSSINQFLLIADYLSQKANSVKFYQMGVGGELTVKPIRLERNQLGKITLIESSETIVRLEYQGNVVSKLQVADN
jgi:hypothetical protein